MLRKLVSGESSLLLAALRARDDPGYKNREGST